jgi:hypothetical protein
VEALEPGRLCHLRAEYSVLEIMFCFDGDLDIWDHLSSAREGVDTLRHRGDVEPHFVDVVHTSGVSESYGLTRDIKLRIIYFGHSPRDVRSIMVRRAYRVKIKSFNLSERVCLQHAASSFTVLGGHHRASVAGSVYIISKPHFSFLNVWATVKLELLFFFLLCFAILTLLVR